MFTYFEAPASSEGGELMGVEYLAQQPPLTASFREAEAMSRKIRAEFEAT